MGTQLLFTDIRVAAELLVNQLRVYQVAERERKKLRRTLNDISLLIPVTILMLLPVSTYWITFLSIVYLFIYYFLSLTQEHTFLCMSMTFNEFSILKLDQPIKYSNFILM